jgi:hypothetical protein
MTPDEHIKALQKSTNDLITNYNGNLMAHVGGYALQMIYDRVHGKGEMANGSQFPGYSTKDTLVGCKSFYKKSACEALLGNKKKRAALEWRTVGGSSGYAAYLSVSSGSSGMAGSGGGVRLAILQGGYKKIRELQGYETGFVNFEISGRMWANIKLISSNSDHQNGIAKIGATGEDNKKKLEGNTKRKGDILDLSQKEINELKQTYTLDVLQVFKNNGL